jgi:uncharacterized protein (TIGR02246 family)
MLNEADRQEIENLVRCVDEAATRRDDEGYAALYAEDGAMEGSKGNAEGRVAIRAAVKAVWAQEPAGSEHLTRSIAIAEESGQIIARSNLLIVAPGLAAPFAQASVAQTVRRTDEGWRIARRLIAAATSGTEGALSEDDHERRNMKPPVRAVPAAAAAVEPAAPPAQKKARRKSVG